MFTKKHGINTNSIINSIFLINFVLKKKTHFFCLYSYCKQILTPRNVPKELK